MIYGLQLIVKYFNNDIVFYSQQLFDELYKAFAKMVQVETEDADNQQQSPTGILKTMDKLLEINANTEVFPFLEKKVSEVIYWGLKHINWEMQDDIFQLVLTMVKGPKVVSQSIWQYYTDILETVIGDEKEVESFKKEFPNQIYEGFGYESLHEVNNIIAQIIVK